MKTNWALVSAYFYFYSSTLLAAVPESVEKLSSFSSSSSFAEALPSYGLELLGSGGDIGPQFNGASTSTRTLGWSLQADFQPGLFQKFGVLGVGPSVSIFPSTRKFADTLPSMTFAWSAGAHIRYQARYFRNQILVPTLSYRYEQVQYRVRNGQKGSFGSYGPGAGLWLYLNALDSGRSQRFFEEYGVSRFYLVGEMHLAKSTKSEMNLGDRSYYFGLRSEF